MRREALPRIAAVAAVVTGLIVVVALLLGGGSYTIHARFPDAGQLVRGGLVQVAGRNVGKIDRITLTNDGAADVEMHIDDRHLQPLHEGTRAAIRAVGLASVANRFVELSPGPDNAPKIRDGGVLDMNHTRGIVDLDVLLDTLDKPTRTHLQRIVAQAAEGLAKPTGRQLNAALVELNPALSQTAALGQELTLDQAALSRLVRTAEQTASTLAARPEALRGALAGTSAALGQLAAERAALGDSLDRASGVLGQTQGTLRSLQAALPSIDPVLRDARPAAGPLARFLRKLRPVTRDAQPTFDAVLKLLPKAKRALHPLPALSRQAVPALRSGSKALGDLVPVLAGLRPYAPDMVAGLFEGLGGSTSGYYDANGHYARISFAFGGGGLPGLIPAPPSGSLGGLRTGLTSRCPGGATEPAQDGSNPVDPGNGICDPKDDQR